MEPGSSYRTYLPNMGKSPELDGIDDAFVAIYAGPVKLEGILGNPRFDPITEANQVVCVVLPAGEVHLYLDVSRVEMTLPEGATINP